MNRWYNVGGLSVIVLDESKLQLVSRNGVNFKKENLEKNNNNNIIILEKQFGKKIGRHAVDFGFNASVEGDRKKIYEFITDIVENSEEKRVGN